MKRVHLSLLLLCFCLACASGKKAATPAAAAPAPSGEAKAPEIVTTPPPAAAPEPVVSPTSPPVASENAVDSPIVVIKKYTEELKSIVQPEKKTEKAKLDTTQERQIAQKVRQFFDFEGLARKALGRHWNRVTSAQRKEYLELFVGLIEESYLRRTADIVGDYKIVYKNEVIKGTQAKVTSSVIREDADVDIIYDLHKNPAKWMIFNISLDNVDLVRNYQTQFNRIIEIDGFNELLVKMRKKKDEIEKNGDT